MKKPTERQKYILELADTGRLWFQPAFGSWHTPIAQYMLPSDEQNPTRPEGKKLLDLGWLCLVEDKDHYVDDNKTGERIYDQKARLTDAGRNALEGE